jgi:predicted kinase
MQTVILTVGLPRSGKSTWSMQQNVPVVNRDSIRLALHGKDYVQSAEAFVSKVEELMVKSLLVAGHPKIIIDATHTTVAYRNRWTRVLKDMNVDIKYKEFLTDADICKSRAKDTGKLYLLPVIAKMTQAFVSLTDEERICTYNE